MSRTEARNIWKLYDQKVEAVKDLSFVCEDGEFMVFLGPSGCGKSSTMRMIAGLEEITRGELLFDGKVVNDLSPQERNIALAFESYALYPTLTVHGNLAFPLEARKLPRAEIDRKVKRVAEMMDLTELLNRKPANLSGGQQQRVSLARALVRDPNVFLLDEPLSHMDQRVRTILRARIRRIHDELGATTIYVTHDQEEAIALADKVLVMNAGVVEQVGTVDELWNYPVSKFVAGFLGEPSMNFVEGIIEKPGEVSIPSLQGRATFRLRKDVAENHVGSAVTVGIRPDKIVAVAEKQENSLPAQIDLVEPLGEIELLTLRIDGGGTEIKAVVSRSQKTVDTQRGKTIWLHFREKDIHVFHKETERALLAG